MRSGRHCVARVSEVPAEVPRGYERHSQGYRRVSLVDGREGAVHTGLGLCRVDRGGGIDMHVHSYEESFFILRGRAVLSLDGRPYELRANDYGVLQVGVPHAWRAAEETEWLEMASPQPRSAPADTFFIPGEVPATALRPDLADPTVRYLGHFEDAQLPPPSHLQMDGYSGANVERISLKMMIDRALGARHLTMFMVEFQPGGAGNIHDHPFEECYFLVAGEADAVLDGKRYRVRSGDVVWTGVGGVHGFFNVGAVPVRWIETQSPQPPAQQAFRFLRDWEYFERRPSGG